MPITAASCHFQCASRAPLWEAAAQVRNKERGRWKGVIRNRIIGGCVGQEGNMLNEEVQNRNKWIPVANYTYKKPMSHGLQGEVNKFLRKQIKTLYFLLNNLAQHTEPNDFSILLSRSNNICQTLFKIRMNCHFGNRKKSQCARSW